MLAYKVCFLLLPLACSVLIVLLVSICFSERYSYQESILQARDVLLSDTEIKLASTGVFERNILSFINYLQKISNLNYLVLSDIRNMLQLMGIETTPERILAGWILKGIVGALPIFILPILTQCNAYYLLYPVFVVIIIYQNYLKLKKGFEAWQREIIKDIPELVDKLRISFSCGKSHLSAFMQARDHSGVKMKVLIERLINDFQYMSYATALDQFADSFKMPIMNKFVSAIKIAIEHGYESADNYFQIIEQDIVEVRRVAIEELTKSKPEKVYQLYFIVISMAVASLGLKGWEIFKDVNKIF